MTGMDNGNNSSRWGVEQNKKVKVSATYNSPSDKSDAAAKEVILSLFNKLYSCN